MALVIWVDSDPNVYESATVFRNKGWEVKCLNKIQECLNALKNDKELVRKTKCVIINMMENYNRNQTCDQSDLKILDEIKKIFKSEKLIPLIAVITKAENPQEYYYHGVELVFQGDSYLLQNEIIERLGDCTKSEPEAEVEAKNEEYKWPDAKSFSCEKLQDKGKRFLEQLGLNKDNLDSTYNKCFCQTCHPKSSLYVGKPPKKYFVPIGWYRYGLKLQKSKDQLDVGYWHPVFHGTNIDCTKSILTQGEFKFPCDNVDNIKSIQMRHGSAIANYFYLLNFSDNIIYLSPSIKYVSNDRYAKPEPFEDNINVKVVIECRIKPNSYKICSETMGII